MDMFSRLKGAIDTRIAEEQARQRQAAVSATPQRPQQRRRPQAQNGNGSGSRVASRQRETGSTTNDKGPDPSEFEPEFAIGDDDSAVPSRVTTPLPETQTKQKADQDAPKQDEEDTPREVADGKQQDNNDSPAPPVRPPELPAEVRTRLKKLDRLEAKYGELLKAYRIAHTKIQAVEPFEATLREHTPLTNINEPSALVEYLAQVTTKSDMVLEEFKRVSAERDELKKKAQQSEDTASQLRLEVAELKKSSAELSPYSLNDKPLPDPAAQASSQDDAPPSTKEVSSPTASIKSPASSSSRIPSFSLFSPRAKATSPPPKDAAEDLFSYDSEVPKLEEELLQRQNEVDALKTQMQKLKGDLVVARESTEGMAQSLESATRELLELRDAKDKFDEIKESLEKRATELEEQLQQGEPGGNEAKAQMDRLRTENERLSKEVEAIKKQIETLEHSKKEAEAQLATTKSNANILNEKLFQKDAVVKDLEDTLAMAKSAERQAAKQKMEEESSEKKLGTMQGIMDQLRNQLDEAESTVENLREQIQTNQSNFAARPSTKVFGFLDQSAQPQMDTLNTKDDVLDFLATNFGLQKQSHDVSNQTLTTPAPSEAPSAPTSKKNKKKKKKGKGGTTAESQEPENSARDPDEEIDVPETASGGFVGKLEEEVRTLKAELEAKGTIVDRLSQQLKDQEALKEEIETLRDDLLHQGEEHVEARDALKTAQAERKTLSEKIEALEQELSDIRKEASSTKELMSTHESTVHDLEDLRTKSSGLQKDLEVAEQLATARFKDITDLKDVLSKAQPELRSLRAEAAELKAAKEDLKNKGGELSRLETRYEDLKSEMKGLSRRLGDKDVEIKELQQKIDQETSTRIKAEEDLRTSQSELRSTEARRQDAVNTSSEYSQDLKKAKDDAARLRSQVASLEDQVSAHDRQTHELREEIGLKTALHSSSQNLVQSLRDQTHELTIQAREASARAESLEEELAEAQRMLSERTREGQTMRMLLNQSETGIESRIREMKERMDAAIEERDRIEDETSVSSRRTMRELDDAKSKARDAQRALKIVEDEKDEIEVRQRDWKRQRDDLEKAAERASKEAEEVRAAITGLREALNESERQVREMESQKSDFRRIGDEAKERVEKLTKANKNLTEELKMLQNNTKRPSIRPGLESGIRSSRTSIDSSSARSPAPTTREGERPSTATSRSDTPTGLSQGTVDYVYLKNVLLQFLEQKDKTHQRQLIPVIGMLLHFDRKDEQKWMSAITTR